MTPEKREQCAITLFKKMEHLDPTEDGNIEDDDWGWSKLNDYRKDFYRYCVDAVVREIYGR